MTARTELKDAERHYLIGCLRASAADSPSGKPDWSAIAQSSGRAVPVLRRLWLKAGAMCDPQTSVDAGPLDPVHASDVDYWRWRWSQVQTEIGRAESDVARTKLMSDQDKIWSSLRAALTVAGASTARTPEQEGHAAEDLAFTAPPALAVRLAAGLRRRGVI